jgi:acyl-coenzyme A thioesterase PaaI-like protein
MRLRSRIEHGVVVLEYLTQESDLGWRHAVHGGISMLLLDEVMTWAAILSARRACLAAEISVRMKRPVSVGRRVRAEGRASAGKTRLVLTEGRRLGLDGDVLALATGKYLPMPAEQVAGCADDFVTGPHTLDPKTILSLSD